MKLIGTGEDPRYPKGQDFDTMDADEAQAMVDDGVAVWPKDYQGLLPPISQDIGQEVPTEAWPNPQEAPLVSTQSISSLATLEPDALATAEARYSDPAAVSDEELKQILVDKGIGLDSIQGTGENGVRTRADVVKAIAQHDLQFEGSQ